MQRARRRFAEAWKPCFLGNRLLKLLAVVEVAAVGQELMTTTLQAGRAITSMRLHRISEHAVVAQQGRRRLQRSSSTLQRTF